MSPASREVVVRGPRLALSRFREDDVDAVQAFASDPEVCRFTTWGPNTLDETRDFIANALGRGDDSLELAVMRGDDLIGSAAVWTVNKADRVGEMGYTIRRDCWGQGYATEVAPLLLHLGFERLELERIAATCDPANAPSIRVLTRAGLRQEGLLRGLNLVRGQRRDRLVFGCLATDF